MDRPSGDHATGKLESDRERSFVMRPVARSTTENCCTSNDGPAQRTRTAAPSDRAIAPSGWLSQTRPRSVVPVRCTRCATPSAVTV